MTYKARVRFADLKDGRHLYEAGEEYPRPGLIVDDKRIAELAGSDNRAGYPLIEASNTLIDTPEEKGIEIPVEQAKPAQKRRRTAKKG